MAVRIKRMDLLYSMFNENIWGEAKANIDIVTSYFSSNEKDNKLVKVLLDFINKSDYTDVTPTKLRYEVSKVEELIDEEIDAILNKIKYYVKLDDNDILRDHANKLEANCGSQAIINAKSEAGDDVVKYLELINKYEYKSTFSEEMTVVNFKDIDVDKAISDSFTKFADSEFEFVKRAYPSVDGWLSAQMIMVVGKPGGGKSLFMMQTTLDLCKQGKRGLYVALGDLKPASFIIRMGAQLLGISLTEAARRSKACADKLREEVEDRLMISCVPADRISVHKFMKKVKSMISQFDFCVVDYDSNFQSKNDNLYKEGGEIYSNLSELTLVYNKLCFVGCQPKNFYWKKESLPMEAGGESSRKQQFIDGEITIGCISRNGINSGYINFCKNRNGNDNVSVPYVRTNDGRLHQVSRAVYSVIKDQTSYDELSSDQLQQIIDHTDESRASIATAELVDDKPDSSSEFFEDPTEVEALEKDDNLPY